MNEKPVSEVKILAVEDDPGDFGLIRVYLRLAGYGEDIEHDTVSWAMSLSDAKNQAASFVPDVVLLDLNLPDSDGLATMIAMRNALPGIPIIVLSGNDNKDVAIDALNEGAQDYLVKGSYEHDALGRAITHALVRARLESRLRLFEVALNSVSNGIVITDIDARIQWANPAFTQLTGFTLEEAIGRKPNELVSSGKQSQPFYQDLWETILSGSSWHGEIINRRKLGELYHENLSISPVMDKNRKITNFVAIKQDITERKNADAQIHHLAHYDPLTDLPNRVLFSDRLQRALVAAKRDNSHLALMFLDLDKFKPINDDLGHHVGDMLLKEAAKRMQSCVRESDTVARIGGDEFVVLLPIIETEQDAVVVAEKIRYALNQPFELVGKRLSISSSTGIVVYPEHGMDETQLIKNADIAMYNAKESGRNNVMLFKSDMQLR